MVVNTYSDLCYPLDQRGEDLSGLFANPSTLVLGTLGLVLFLVLFPASWQPLRTFIGKVQSIQERDFEKASQLIGRWPIFLIVLTAPAWVALLMIQHLIGGGDPMETLLGAVVTAAVGAGAWRSRKAYAIGTVPAAIMYYLILYARPLAQAGAVVLAAWFLLIGGMRFSWEFVQAIWNIVKTRKDITILVRYRVLALIALVFSIVALVVGARRLLQWDHGVNYDASFQERPLPWPRFGPG